MIKSDEVQIKVMDLFFPHLPYSRIFTRATDQISARANLIKFLLATDQISALN